MQVNNCMKSLLHLYLVLISLSPKMEVLSLLETPNRLSLFYLYM